MSQGSTTTERSSGRSHTYDVIVIGAGLAGLYQLKCLRDHGFSVRVFEVGGTWYWNRYPGARFDSESHSYGCFIHRSDPRSALEVSAEEREAFYEKLYDQPGFAIWMGATSAARRRTSGRR